jgi:hypothetical protein
MHNGQQPPHGHDCGRQYVDGGAHDRIAEDKGGLLARVLLARLALRGICRAVGVTIKGLLGFLVQCCKARPDPLHVHPLSCTRDVLIQRLEVEADALASLVPKKAHKQWVWIALEATPPGSWRCT